MNLFLTLEPGETTDELDVVRPGGCDPIDPHVIKHWLQTFPQIQEAILPSRYERIDGYDEETGLWVPVNHSSIGEGVEERLSRPFGLRTGPLTTRELPQLADAIVVAVRGKGRVSVIDVGGAKWVRIFGNGVDVSVLEDDWRKILPFLQDSTLDPMIHPTKTSLGVDLSKPFDPAWISYRDEVFRSKVLGLLASLFTTAFPTSDI